MLDQLRKQKRGNLKPLDAFKHAAHEQDFVMTHDVVKDCRDYDYARNDRNRHYTFPAYMDTWLRKWEKELQIVVVTHDSYFGGGHASV